LNLSIHPAPEKIDFNTLITGVIVSF